MEMYNNRFVVSVIVNGQIVKEHGNEVHLPFGVEYTLRFRNKHNRRAVVKLFIDGEEQSKGGYIIPANSYRDIERNSHSPKKFKFVDLQSADAQDFGKDQSNKDNKMGLIEAHFYLEAVPPPSLNERWEPKPDEDVWLPIRSPGYPSKPKNPWKTPGPYEVDKTKLGYYDPTSSQAMFACNDCGPTSFTQCASGNTLSLNDLKQEVVAANPQVMGVPVQETMKRTKTGCTVEGGESSQQFGEMHLKLEENFTAIRIYMRGIAEAAPAPVRGYCDSCGAKALRESSRFCHACGAKL